MKSFFKKYWPHMINIAFCIVCDILFSVINFCYLEEESSTVFGIFSILTVLLLVIGVWVEIIYYIVKIATSKELNNKVVHIICVWFLNLFYIPCFNLKHICKDEQYKLKNIVYLALSIALYIIMIALVIRFEFVCISNM